MKKLLLSLLIITIAAPAIFAGCGGSVPVAPEVVVDVAAYFKKLYAKNKQAMEKIVQETLPAMTFALVNKNLASYTEKEKILLIALTYTYQIAKTNQFTETYRVMFFKYMVDEGNAVLDALPSKQMTRWLKISLIPLLEKPAYAGAAHQPANDDKKDNL